ncbi:MAG TPA: DMT family transporter [Flavobacteriales bacterium]|nr:DMT family transporter [Flavobacteriales bacterium]
MKFTLADRRLKWLLLGILSVIWGSSFILMKRGLFQDGEPALTPMQLASARLFIAWVVLSPLLFRHAGLLRAHWKPLLGTALAGNGIPAFLFAVAQSRIDSSLAGMLNTLSPLFTLLVGVLLFGVRTRFINVVGVLLGLFGALGTIYFRQAGDAPVWTVYAVLPILGAVCYGFSGNIVKSGLYMVPATAISALAISIVGPLGLVGIILTDLPGTLATVPHAWHALGYVTILAVFGTGLSLILWNILIKLTSAVWAASVTYVMPIVAIGWGLLDGEVLRPMQLAMVGTILLGVYLVNKGTDR